MPDNPTIEIAIDEATPFLVRLQRALKDTTQLNKFLANTTAELTRNYLRRRDTQIEHKSARRVGAAPSGHLAKAAEAVRPRSSATAAEVVIPARFGLRRAFQKIVITTPTARGKKWLTIPAHPSSYGKRAGEFADLEFRELVPGKKAILTKRGKSDGKHIVLFILVKKVTIPQDRKLLPSDEQFMQGAELGARDYIRAATDGNDSNEGSAEA